MGAKTNKELRRRITHVTMETPRYLKHIIGVIHVEVLCRPYIFLESHNHIMNL
jgi:hypothetical protein